MVVDRDFIYRYRTNVLQEFQVQKLVPWGTDGRLPLSGDFRSLILE